MKLADVPVAILAGGLGTRLGPLTEAVPKALLDVAGRPFIDRQLALLRERGLRRVVLCVGHLGRQIEEHVGDGSTHGMDVVYSHDEPSLLGTAGALRQAAAHLGDLFWVTYGDSYVDIDYQAVLDAFLAQDRMLGVMTVFRNEGRWDRSNVVFRGGRLIRYDRTAADPEMTHIDLGVLLLRREALSDLPEGKDHDLADLLRDLAGAGRLSGYEVHERFYEIGSLPGLHEARTRFAALDQPDSYVARYLSDAAGIVGRLDAGTVERTVSMLVDLRRRGGRLFILGVGGCAANASHAVNDFRKLCHIEAYAPTDNVSELTARVNDEGWERVFVEWLRVSRLSEKDLVLVFSVGGGDLERGISTNLVAALDYARGVGAAMGGIVGPRGGHAARLAETCIMIPAPADPQTVTPHTEALQAVVWHLLVSHPRLNVSPTKWESTLLSARGDKR